MARKSAEKNGNMIGDQNSSPENEQQAEGGGKPLAKILKESVTTIRVQKRMNKQHLQCKKEAGKLGYRGTSPKTARIRPKLQGYGRTKEATTV